MTATLPLHSLLNDPARPPIVYHLGIDAGFFTEYTYMLHAMLFALRRGRRFCLYSADANFGVARGWTDYFLPFCQEVSEPFHSRYNRHAIPSLPTLLRRNPGRSPLDLAKWKLKVEAGHLIGHIKARQAYGRPTWLNADVDFRVDAPFPYAELGLGDDYLTAFRTLVDLTWRFTPEVEHAVVDLTKQLRLPKDYIGCQLWGGDKVSEVSLTSPDALAEAIRRLPSHDDVFVLTDDYRLFEELQSRHADIRWHTLCSPDERGYVNSAFTATSPERKRAQMVRFLASMRLLMQSRHFVGSITPGPSLFLLKYLWPNATPQDCLPADFARAITLPIVERGRMAQEFLKNHSNPLSRQ